MSIYTKTGDSGETSLYGGSRVSKDDLRVWCYGTVDEFNSILGVVYAALTIPKLRNIVREVQEKLFILGAELASDDKVTLKARITAEDTAHLEKIIDSFTKDLDEFTEFTIPGETLCSALFHVARTVVRRCERHVIRLAEKEYVSPEVLKYINRLSDFLFVLAQMEVFEMFVKQVVDKVVTFAGIKTTGIWTEENCAALYRAAAAESAKIGISITFAIADESGTVIYFHSQPGAVLASVPIAQNKAYTSVAMRMPTGDLSKIAAPGGALFGINTADPKLVIFGGGFPLFKDGNLIGAIGISGGSVPEDEQIGKAVLAVFDSQD